ncbi:acetyl-CoA/propionyl-CoA carboxylase, biotin carboxylase, biotin carboxyl carrier protein [Thermoflexales bacterium]|nr:acetyl-CoA/propionyl-CoA carboxylase, biotin carboxylase, biotin carboxyl carrier protein [Thermoflexales bacterium]
MLDKLLIANRGEIAVRIMRACQELEIRTVAIYSEADAQALHVRLADEAIPIGSAAPRESYLRGDKIIAAAQSVGAQAIHPGFGFLSENADFADAVREAGLIFIGPAGASIRRMGSKTRARAIMQLAGVPIVPGYEGGIEADFGEAAGTIGYPVLVKAAAGGGGKGMRMVQAPQDLADAIEAAQREAEKAFGDPTIFLEKYVQHAHHVEFQIFGDLHGNLVHLFERDCSTQRRHQKIIEETPSPLLDDELRQRMAEAAVTAAQAVAYHNAGTIEFIVDPETRAFYFLEMNTRLQVEHPVTELITGLDLVKLQIKVAGGEPLPFTQEQITARGHAIECRVYAEDVANGFLPAVGPVLLAKFPVMPGVRVDSGIETGDEVSIHYDPMIAKIIAYGPDRVQAIRKLAAALANTLILGLTTNVRFLRDVLAHPAFQRGEVTTNFIEREFAGWNPVASESLDLALIAAALLDVRSTIDLPTPNRPPQASNSDPWQMSDRFRPSA